VTHTENRIWNRILPAGKEWTAISSTPKACGLLFHHPPEARNPLSCGATSALEAHTAPGPVFLKAGKHLLPCGKNRLAQWQEPVHLGVVLDHFWRAK
jgi:hypothetical protein